LPADAALPEAPGVLLPYDCNIPPMPVFDIPVLNIEHPANTARYRLPVRGYMF
jgi:hypothetical protein